jgi:serine/threonine protein kinase/Tfp pilus assembly protein PilF
MKCSKCHSDNPDTQKFCGECAAPLTTGEDIQPSLTKTLLTLVEDLPQGALFANRYEIIEELGKGGMGKVYKALDNEIHEEVAIKLLKPEIAADEKIIERFRNELKIARKISHKNVCRTYHISKEGDTPYITMEYVRGEDLKNKFKKKGVVPKKEALGIAKQVCEGLLEAHKLGVVHRDLKPQNIMIDVEGNAKIMDFGIARSIEAPGVTQKGVIIGTPDYISPEQAEGQEADHRSDIYSMGVILYEMVTGTVPFKGDSALSVALKHKSQLPSDPRKLNPEVSDDLAWLILICMEKGKERRYQTAEALLDDLRNIEEGFPLGTKIQPRRETFTQKLIRKKLLIPAVVVTLTLIAVIIWQSLPNKEAVPSIPSKKPSIAVMYFKNNTGDENFDTWRSALSDSIITDLSQSKYMKVMSGDKLYSILRKFNLLEAESYASEDLMKVATEGEVNHILQGGLSKAGDIFRIDYTLQDINTGEIIGSNRAEGRGEESIFSMVDEVTRRIKSNLKLSEMEIASDIDKDVGQITTGSSEAYKLYVEGRRYHHNEELWKSIQYMEKAVAIDPEFAMAYRSMAASYGNLSYGGGARKYRKKAFELKDNLSDRESYLIQGDFFRTSEKTYNKAIEAFNSLLQLYPEDLSGNTNLAIIYKKLEQWDKVIERCEVLIQAQEKTHYPYMHLADALERKGLYERARKVLEDYLNNISDSATIHWNLADNFFVQGEFDYALAEADKALELFPKFVDAIWLKGYIYLCKGDLKKAQNEFQKLVESEEQFEILEGWAELASLLWMQGKLRESRDHLEKGLELAQRMGEKVEEPGFYLNLSMIDLKLRDYKKALERIDISLELATDKEMLGAQRWALFWKTIIYIEMGEMEKGTKAADELNEMIKKGMNKKNIRLHDYVLGIIALKKNNITIAIENFKKALSLVGFQETVPSEHALFMGTLAHTYYKSGDMIKAQREYEGIISLTTGRAIWGDIFAKSFYMLGKIHEQQGDKAKAIEHYEKFLDLWKDADPGIAEVEDARKKLAGLKD